MVDVLTRVRGVAAPYRVQSAAIGGSILALVAFAALGVRLRRSAEPLRVETHRLSAMVSEVSGFRAAFVPSSPGRDGRITRFADSLGVAIARDNRVALAQQVAAHAEALGLSGVRVRFAPADSFLTPDRPSPATKTMAVADYALALDADGSLAAVVSLVDQLPPSVALERLAAVRARDAAHYRLSFAVFETTANDRSRAGAPLAELMSFTKPVAESLPAAIASGNTAAISRDPFGAVAARPIVRLAAQPARPAPKADVPIWDVTATLIAGVRRAALINGVLVSVGDAAPGGVTLTAVERDRVVLTDQKGAAHTIAVKEGER